MNSLKLLSLARKRDGVPTLNGPALNRKEQTCAETDMCVVCVEHPQTDTSFRCPACEAADTVDAIAKDISNVRQRLLNNGNG